MSKLLAVEANQVLGLEGQSLDVRAAISELRRSITEFVGGSHGNAALQPAPEQQPSGLEAFFGNSISFEARPRANLDNLAMLEAGISAAGTNPARSAGGALVIERTKGGYEVALAASAGPIEFLFDRQGNAPLNSPEELRLLRDTISGLARN